MKKFHFVFAVALIALVSAGLTALAEGQEKKAKILKGQYVWTQQPDEPGNIEGVFTPTGDHTWDVTFNFEFDGRDWSWSGNAEGKMGSSLKGTIYNEKKDSSFTFEGEFKDGEFKGKHAHMAESGARETGTITLK